jgi:hypothetical protein
MNARSKLLIEANPIWVDIQAVNIFHSFPPKDDFIVQGCCASA